MKQFGTPTGSGNPPGEHSDSYLDMPSQSGHFVANKGYRGDMHVGVDHGMPIVGNQPQEHGEMSVDNWTGKPSLRKPEGTYSK